jgi:hypothetical protein
MDLPTADASFQIVTLVGAVTFLFGIIITLMRETIKERKSLQLQLNVERKENSDKLEEIYKANLEDQKKWAILLNDNIQLIESLTSKK